MAVLDLDSWAINYREVLSAKISYKFGWGSSVIHSLKIEYIEAQTLERKTIDVTCLSSEHMFAAYLRAIEAMKKV
jgi:hypothetical protein